ncbi:response regulator [soil metagenome]
MMESRRAVKDVLEGVTGQAAEDQLLLAQQALAQIRESVVITETELEEPGPAIVYVNAAFTKMTGWLPEEVTGRSPRLLQGPKTTRKTLDRLRRQLENGEAFEGEDINYRKDGSEFFIDWYIEPLHGPDGEINYWVAVQRDVTEKRELQAQLLQAQRLEGIGLLASGIAHDLNNVLTPVLMGCEYLRAQVASEDAREFIQLIEDSGRRGAGLVRQILSFGRGLSGGSVQIDPRHIVDEVATMAQATFPKAIEVLSDAPVATWSVEADASQLHQVVLNLCINARDAIEGPGTIRLMARNVETKAPLPMARGELRPGRYVQVSVSDSGSGMPAEVAGKIFDPFFSTKAPGKGTGLGLSTVATIVHNLCGGIDLRTAPGQGTSFSIYLPAAAETAATDEAPAPGVARGGAGRTVLIADDETAIATIMREVLESAGYRAQTVASGLEALLRIAAQPPDLFILDSSAPGATFSQIMTDLRERFPELPVVVISGRSEDEMRAETGGIRAFLQKPFAPDQLLAEVHQVLAATAGGD